MNAPSRFGPEIRERHGMVGFFDILGFKHILERKELSNVVNLIRGIRSVCHEFKTYHDDNWGPSDFGFTFLSDSIIITTNLDAAKETSKPYAWVISELLARLFEEGLPTRG